MIEHDEHGPMLSPEEMSALLGVDVDELTATINAQRTGDGPCTVRLPAAWLEQGRSRADVYRQATGDNDVTGAIAFWQAQRTTSEGDTQ